MAATNATNGSDANASVGRFRLAAHGLFAAIGTSVANVVILFLALAVVEFPSEFVGGPFGPLAVGPVVVNSVVAALGATLVYGVVVRFAARPNRTFVAVAGIALVLSFAMFLAPDLSDAPVEVFAVLAVMHASAAVVVVGVLTRAPGEAVAPEET